MGLIIRPSSLGSYADCPRRTVARSMPLLVADAGFVLTKTPGNIAASVGTATHAAVAYTLTEKMNSGELGNATEAEQRGVEALKEDMERSESTMYDDTAPTLAIAQRQVARMTMAYRRVVAPKINPTAVEQRYEASFGPFTIGGTLDVATDGVRDCKTGAKGRVHLAQLGTYGLLRKAHGEEVTNLWVDFVQRVAIAKEQPEPVSTPYGVELAEKVAKSTIVKFARDVEAFQRSGDPMEFSANTMSSLCSAKWCPCHGTKFCPETRV